MSTNQFDPTVDIHLDAQGMYKLAGNKIQLRRDIQTYFAQRNEDSIDV